jgi:glutamate/tyrosine decarboxylase-like PLP-dependent enzyme
VVSIESEWRAVLTRTTELALGHLETVGERPVARGASMGDLVAALGGPLPAGPGDPARIVEALARGAEPGLVVTNGGRYFGFVEGGVLPAALAADWLTAAWDQNPGFYVLSPAAAATEEICRSWLCELLGLPPACSAGFTTGAQMANYTGLAAGLRHVLGAAGWDLEADGLFGAPAVSVVVGEERHATIDRALRFLGVGRRQITAVAADDQGRMRASALRDALADGPTIVCAQAGNVNTGAFDPLREICALAHARGAWVHVDGAFGLWAATAPSLRHLVDGVELADSWATDAHKWLNVPYDSGIVLCAHPDRHRAAMTLSASYLARTGGRDGADWTPEGSRRARAFAVWASLRSLGRSGVADLVEGSCAHARRFADILGAEDEIAILNDVVLNQVLVRVGDDDERTRAVAAAVQSGGATWLGTTVRHGKVALRISVSDHATDDDDVAAAAAAVLRAVHG